MAGGTNCRLGLASGSIPPGNSLLTDYGQQTGSQPKAKRHAILLESASIRSSQQPVRTGAARMARHYRGFARNVPAYHRKGG
jgi:hypothetical protein